MNANPNVLVGHYDYAVVAMSLLIAFLGSFAALELADHIRTAHSSVRSAWIAGTAVTQGVGIWSMHYTGMLAFHLPLPTRYDWPMALLSFVIAMSVASVAVAVVTQRRRMAKKRTAIAGTIMGMAITGQHYTAMASMRVSAMPRYAAPLVVLSVVFAILFAVLSLWLMFRVRVSVGVARLRQTGGAFQMATAICLMHYTAMSAVTFVRTDSFPDWLHAVPITAYGVAAIGASTVAALTAAIVTSLWDHHWRGSIERQEEFNRLRAFAARLQSAREEERTNVAREIHDELGQTLTGINLELASLARDLPPDLRPRAESIRGLVDATIQDVRRIATDLRPGILDDLGLAAAVEWAADDFRKRTGIRVYVDLPGGDISLGADGATAIFRILQEALTNVARHAEASEVHVQLAPEGENVALEVRDNGRGLDRQAMAAAGSLGILGMRERAMLVGGTLTVESGATRGTIARVTVPSSVVPERQR